MISKCKWNVGNRTKKFWRTKIQEGSWSMVFACMCIFFLLDLLSDLCIYLYHYHQHHQLEQVLSSWQCKIEIFEHLFHNLICCADNPYRTYTHEITHCILAVIFHKYGNVAWEKQNKMSSMLQLGLKVLKKTRCFQCQRLGCWCSHSLLLGVQFL